MSAFSGASTGLQACMTTLGLSGVGPLAVEEEEEEEVVEVEGVEEDLVVLLVESSLFVLKFSLEEDAVLEFKLSDLVDGV